MPDNILTLLDAYETAQAETDLAWLIAGESEAAAAAYDAANAAQESAIDAAVATLMQLEPTLQYNTARAMVVIPAYRAKIRAQYGG